MLEKVFEVMKKFKRLKFEGDWAAYEQKIVSTDNSGIWKNSFIWKKVKNFKKKKNEQGNKILI